MAGPLHGSDLEDVLTDLADTGDQDITLLVTALRNIADRSRTGHLTPDRTQLLIAVLAASPDGTDVIGAVGHLIADLTADTNPALHHLTDQARKDAVHAGEQAAFHLTDPDLREPASRACAALDTRREVPPMTRLTDREREEMRRKVREANKRSENSPR